MIEKSDIITCKSYQPLCDYLYDYPNLDDIPPTGLVHVPLDHIDEFFKRVDSNGHRYVVVSSCSDYGIASQREHPAWKDMIKWVGMQVGPSIGYNGLQTAARVDVERCNVQHPISVKMHSWTKSTLPSIPNNIHHWFITNLMLVPNPEVHEFLYDNDAYKKLTAIPFGIAEGKDDEIYSAMQTSLPISEKKNKIYISWNDTTLERHNLRNSMIEWDSTIRNLSNRMEHLPAPGGRVGNNGITVKSPSEPDPYEEYLKKLSNHKYVLSPTGNGADCYRTLEAIYMGCIAMVQQTSTNYLTNLPVLQYRNIPDIINWYTSNNKQGPPMAEGWNDQPEIKLSHWKELIHSKRSELF